MQITGDGGTDGALHRTDRDGNPNIFKLARNEDGLWLNGDWADLGCQWDLEDVLVFSLRKSDA